VWVVRGCRGCHMPRGIARPPLPPSGSHRRTQNAVTPGCQQAAAGWLRGASHGARAARACARLPPPQNTHTHTPLPPAFAARAHTPLPR
jgi:hypothetical protein